VIDRWGAELEEEKMRIEKIKPSPKTYHEGANDERTAILAKVRRMVGEQPEDTVVAVNGTALIQWLLQRNERYKKRNGGL
jgi:hypothetical protein